MEWVEEFLKDPNGLTILGYGVTVTAVATYAALRNDFGAGDMTDRELESYLEENDPGLSDPLKKWRAREYNKELQSREKEVEELLEEDNYRSITEPTYSDD